MTTTTERRAIRARMLKRAGARKVRITRDGMVLITGEMPRGDGGRVTWTQYAGDVDTLARQM